MEDSGKRCPAGGASIWCWIYGIAHIAALTCIATALWQIWHVLGDKAAGS